MRTSARELLRTARRHRALLAGGLVAAAVALALPGLAPEAPPQVALVAAGRDLPAGTALQPADLSVVRLPRAAAPAGGLADPAAVVGRVVAGPVRRGEALTDVRLLGAALLPAGGGLVAAPVRLADPASAVLLHAGDVVDVLATPAQGGAAVAATVAAAVRVLAVPRPDLAAGEGALVVLAAAPRTAARLAAAAVGSRLSVTVLAR